MRRALHSQPPRGTRNVCSYARVRGSAADIAQTPRTTGPGRHRPQSWFPWFRGEIQRRGQGLALQSRDPDESDEPVGKAWWGFAPRARPTPSQQDRLPSIRQALGGTVERRQRVGTTTGTAPLTFRSPPLSSLWRDSRQRIHHRARRFETWPPYSRKGPRECALRVEKDGGRSLRPAGHGRSRNRSGARRCYGTMSPWRMA